MSKRYIAYVTHFRISIFHAYIYANVLNTSFAAPLASIRRHLHLEQLYTGKNYETEYNLQSVN